MPYSEAFRSRVEAALGVHVALRSRPMFGGVGLYAGDRFFALIGDDRLYFKVDDSNRAEFEARGMEPFYPYNQPPPMSGYYELPPELLNQPEELAIWIERSVAVAEAAAQKKTRRKPV